MPEVTAEELELLLAESVAAFEAERRKSVVKPGMKLAGVRARGPFREGGLVFLPRRGRVFFFGDLHGDPESLEDLLKATGFESLAGKKKNVFLVGLGDYVDRGPDGVGVVVRLLGLRKKFGARVVLLRGDHEDAGVNKVYGFADELRTRYGAKWAAAMDDFHSLYSSLPHAVVTGNGIVGVHGGVPEGVTGLKELAHVKRGALTQVTWNDPLEDVAGGGFAPNWARGSAGIKVFGKKALEDFLDSVGARFLVRAHEWNRSGEVLWNRLVTVFSTHYFGRARRVFGEASLEKPVNNARDLVVKEF